MKQVFIVDDLPKTGFELSLKATDEELEMLKDQLSIQNVESFSAKLTIKQWRRGGVQIEGTYEAAITQECVVTLETFDSVVKEEINQKFFSTTKLPELNDKKEGEMLDNDLDPPDALNDGKLNISDYLVETLLLQLDPYPRKPGSDFEDLATNGKFQINQPTVDDGNSNESDDPNKIKKSNATHKPFAGLEKLLKDK